MNFNVDTRQEGKQEGGLCLSQLRSCWG